VNTLRNLREGASAPSDGVLPYQHRTIEVNRIETHYLEAGEGFPVVLVHSGEFGASAELSWRFNISSLARHFHVYAPDMVGFGLTEKLHHFTGASEFRIRHLQGFCRTLSIGRAHFVGSSYGGSLILRVAAGSDPIAWPIDRIIVISGGGAVPMNEHRETLLSYDGTREHMRRILQVLFYSSSWWAPPMLEDWHSSSMVPGAWQCAAAARLALPGKTSPWRPESSNPGLVQSPTLVVGGAEDYLREPGYASDLAASLPFGRAHTFAASRHFSHIEHATHFNELALDHLLEPDESLIRKTRTHRRRDADTDD
jgi:pimeloyl-ACP methyl ester carboxylesterase